MGKIGNFERDLDRMKEDSKILDKVSESKSKDVKNLLASVENSASYKLKEELKSDMALFIKDWCVQKKEALTADMARYEEAANKINDIIEGM